MLRKIPFGGIALPMPQWYGVLYTISQSGEKLKVGGFSLSDLSSQFHFYLGIAGLYFHTFMHVGAVKVAGVKKDYRFHFPALFLFRRNLFSSQGLPAQYIIFKLPIGRLQHTTGKY